MVRLLLSLCISLGLLASIANGGSPPYVQWKKNLHNHTLRMMEELPDEKLLTVDSLGYAKISNLTDGSLVHDFGQMPCHELLQLSPKKEWLYDWDGHQLYFQHLKNPKKKVWITSERSLILYSISPYGPTRISPNEDYLVMDHPNNTVTIVDLMKAPEQVTLSLHTPHVPSQGIYLLPPTIDVRMKYTLFINHGRYILIVKEDGIVQLIDQFQNFKEVFRFEHWDENMGAESSESSSYFAIFNRKTITLYDVLGMSSGPKPPSRDCYSNGPKIIYQKTFSEDIARIIFSPDHRYAMIQSSLPSPTIVSLSDGKEIPLSLKGRVSYVCFSPDSTHLCVFSYDRGEVVFIDLLAQLSCSFPTLSMRYSSLFSNDSVQIPQWFLDEGSLSFFDFNFKTHASQTIHVPLIFDPIFYPPSMPNTFSLKSNGFICFLRGNLFYFFHPNHPNNIKIIRVPTYHHVNLDFSLDENYVFFFIANNQKEKEICVIHLPTANAWTLNLEPEELEKRLISQSNKYLIAELRGGSIAAIALNKLPRLY